MQRAQQARQALSSEGTGAWQEKLWASSRHLLLFSVAAAGVHAAPAACVLLPRARAPHGLCAQKPRSRACGRWEAFRPRAEGGNKKNIRFREQTQVCLVTLPSLSSARAPFASPAVCAGRRPLLVRCVSATLRCAVSHGVRVGGPWEKRRTEQSRPGAACASRLQAGDSVLFMPLIAACCRRRLSACSGSLAAGAAAALELLHQLGETRPRFFVHRHGNELCQLLERVRLQKGAVLEQGERGGRELSRPSRSDKQKQGKGRERGGAPGASGAGRPSRRSRGRPVRPAPEGNAVATFPTL